MPAAATWGPRPLGADQHVSLEAWRRQDLEYMLLASRRLGVPMIIGSASDTGTDRGVDQFVDLITDIAREHRLPPFKLAAIYSEVPVAELKRRLAAGRRIEGLDGRPDADTTTLERTHRAVAVMNAEPMRQALKSGADVVIAGQAAGCAMPCRSSTPGFHRQFLLHRQAHGMRLVLRGAFHGQGIDHGPRAGRVGGGHGDASRTALRAGFHRKPRDV